MSDFGLSQFFQANTEHLDASKVIKLKHQGVRFIAPELIDDFLQGKIHLRDTEDLIKNDIWAAGVTLYRMMTKEFPVKGISLINLKTQLRAKEPLNMDKIENIEIR